MFKLKSEKGQALIIISFAAIALFGFAALAIDGSRVFSDRRHAQNAADTSVMAAQLARIRGEDAINTGQTRATSNGYNDDGTTNDVTITLTATAPGVCKSAGVDIEVTIVSHVPTTFARILGRDEVINTVSAIARSCDYYVSGGSPLYPGNSIYTTRTTSCGNGVSDKSLYVGGSSHIQLWGGGMGSASSDGNCLHFKGGEAQFKLSETSPKTCADIETASSSGGEFGSVKKEDGCGDVVRNVSFDSPPADLGITCSTNATVSGSTMSPGNYTGTFPPPSVQTLQPGTYCVNGDFTLNGGRKLKGNGVTIVMNNGGIKWNGSMELELTPPTSGDYKGLTIYAPPSNSSQMTLNGSANVVLKGTMLTQSAPCDFIGSGQIQKVTLQMICYTWQMNGNAQAEIMYDASLLYSPGTTEDPTITLLQ
jgi:Flp pilus assembly protein TadG